MPRLLPLLFILFAAAGAAADLPPAARLPAPVSFHLTTGSQIQEAAGEIRAEIHLRRGNLTLGLKVGGPLLSATGAYEWDADEPVLEEGRAVVFRAGRTDLAAPRSLPLPFQSLPRYNLLFGRYEPTYDLFLAQNDGRSTLNLAGLRLSAVDLAVDAGRLEAVFGENAADCRLLRAVLNGGGLALNDLGGIGARAYEITVNSGLASLVFGGWRPGLLLDLALTVNGGTLSLRLPPGRQVAVDMTVGAGSVFLNGKRHGRGSRLAAAGSGEPAGSIRLAVNAGVVKID